MDTQQGIALIKTYFPSLTDTQQAQLAILGSEYPRWNAMINVISRKDIDSLYERHILHSLAIARFLGSLPDGTPLLDLGCGGGFPGIPLAVMYPECRFLLLDRIAKKLKVAQAVAEAAGITNVEFQHGDAGECHRKFSYVVSRAVMPLDGLVRIAGRLVDHNGPHGAFPPGLVCLKGGDLSEEIKATPRKVIREPLAVSFSQEFFSTKEIVYVPM